MKIRIVRYVNKDDELLLAVHVLDEEGKEIDSFQFYNSPEETAKEPMLARSVSRLPDLLKFLGADKGIIFDDEEVLV